VRNLAPLTMNSLLQDLQYAVRQLFKSPGFAVNAIVSLAIAIGATTAIFSVVYGILLDPYPYKSADRIVHVELHRRNGSFSQLMVNARQFEDVRRASSVEDVFFEDRLQKNLTGDKGPSALNVGFYSANFFDYMGVPPIIGREFTSADATGGNSDPVAVLSYALWREHFGESREVLGKTIELDRVSYAIIGIVPPRFTWGNSDVYLLSPNTAASNYYHLAYPRLKPGVKYSAAEAELQTLVDGFAREDVKNYPQDTRVKIASLNEELLGSFAGTILLLFGAVLALLIIGCANVSNLLIARAMARQHEFAVRASVGAGRARIIRQLLTESVLLSVTGAAFGVLAAYWGVQVISAMLPYDSIPHEAVIGLNGPVLIFSVAVALLTGILFGLAPAYQFSRPRISSLLLSSGTRPANRAFSRRMHRLPIAGQVALTVLLLAGAGGAITAFLARINTPLGFNPENVFQMFVELPRSPWHDPIDQHALFNELERIRESVAQAPGVAEAAVSLTWLPLGRERRYDISIASKPSLSDAQAALTLISPQLLSVLRIPLLRGRVFGDSEMRRRAHLAMVNQAFVNRYLSGMDPIGQIMRFGKSPYFIDVPLEVIGVVGDAINDEFEAIQPSVFLPYSLDANLRPGALLFARAGGDPEIAMRSVKARLSEVNPEWIVGQVRTFQGSLETYGWGNARLAATIFALYASIALILSATGIYGVVSFVTTQQRYALGIRLALGAPRRSIVQLVLNSTVAMIVVGVVTGLIVSAILSPIVSPWAVGNLLDPFLLAAAVFIFVLVAAIACLIPAWRAASIDPSSVLRTE
jgi:predicted permease